jgi:hypothetical protein
MQQRQLVSVMVRARGRRYPVRSTNCQRPTGVWSIRRTRSPGRRRPARMPATWRELERLARQAEQ